MNQKDSVDKVVREITNELIREIDKHKYTLMQVRQMIGHAMGIKYDACEIAIFEMNYHYDIESHADRDITAPKYLVWDAVQRLAHETGYQI